MNQTKKEWDDGMFDDRDFTIPYCPKTGQTHFDSNNCYCESVRDCEKCPNKDKDYVCDYCEPQIPCRFHKEEYYGGRISPPEYNHHCTFYNDGDCAVDLGVEQLREQMHRVTGRYPSLDEV